MPEWCVYPEPVATTWSLSFERVEEKNPAAADLLRLCAYLAPDAFLFSQAIEALRAYSLLARDPRAKTLSVHRLVQAVLAVSAARPDVTDVKQWPACERWLPHALLCATWIEQESISSTEAAILLNAAGYYLKQRGRYREVEPLYQRALEIYEQLLGAYHPLTATSLNNLAGLYRVQGKYEQAEPLFQRALAIREQELGALHPSTATSLNNLAALYRTQGKYAEAEPLLQGALSILEQLLGIEHPTTQIVRRNYAALLRAMGREEEARRMEEEL